MPNTVRVKASKNLVLVYSLTFLVGSSVMFDSTAEGAAA